VDTKLRTSSLGRFNVAVDKSPITLIDRSRSSLNTLVFFERFQTFSQLGGSNELPFTDFLSRIDQTDALSSAIAGTVLTVAGTRLAVSNCASCASFREAGLWKYRAGNGQKQ
jgi:hypothetical protein